MADYKDRKFWATRVLDRIPYVENELKVIEACADDSTHTIRSLPYVNGDFMRVGIDKLQKRVNDLCSEMEKWIDELDKEEANGKEEATE